jgi:histone acetyltransferase (RNA polymerase elongator complex component)
MNARPRIYPIFLPHAGCPFQCVYCDQRAVNSAAPEGLLGDQAQSQLGPLLREARKSALVGEVAFYGGTFTALPRQQMQLLLGIVTPYIEEGLFCGIRFSTRPDCLTPDICSFLKQFPVQTVELGVQSFSDVVLARSRRGYVQVQVERACALVREHGWNLGIQLMPGLPGDTPERFQQSVAATIALEPAFVRLYPTVVLAETQLAQWTRSGEYRPLTIEQAVRWCVPAYDAFGKAGIPIARLGLHADLGLQSGDALVAGPYHPAFGQLVRSAWWRERIDGQLAQLPEIGTGQRLAIHVAQRLVSDVVGLGRSNVDYWQQKWQLQAVTVTGEANWPGDRFACHIHGISAPRGDRGAGTGFRRYTATADGSRLMSPR